MAADDPREVAADLDDLGVAVDARTSLQALPGQREALALRCPDRGVARELQRAPRDVGRAGLRRAGLDVVAARNLDRLGDVAARNLDRLAALEAVVGARGLDRLGAGLSRRALALVLPD